MPSLENLWYQLGIKDMTKSELDAIYAKLKNLGADILLTPKIDKDTTQNAVPKEIKIEIEITPSVTNETITKAVECKVMKIEVTPLHTHLRKALKDATVASPPEIEVAIQSTKLRGAAA